MSKTISFVASDELAEFLEEESNRRMTTISSTAQMLLAEHVREMRDAEDVDGSEANSESSSDIESESDDIAGEEETEEEVLKPPKDPFGGHKELFEEHSDRWYRPEGKNAFAIEVNEGDIRYYKTAERAARRLRGDYDN